MKLLLVSCILIIFSICFIHAESEKPPNSFDQYISHMTRETECIFEFINLDELSLDLTLTILQYSGNNAAVRALSDKYCPVDSQVIQCTVTTLAEELDKECYSSTYHAEKRLGVKLQNALLSYVCANNSTVVIQFLENDGLHTIYINKQIKQCQQFIRDVGKIDEETLERGAELCGAVDRAFDCYKNLVRDHENQNLIGITNDVQAIVQQTLKCATAF